MAFELCGWGTKSVLRCVAQLGHLSWATVKNFTSRHAFLFPSHVPIISLLGTGRMGGHTHTTWLKLCGPSEVQV